MSATDSCYLYDGRYYATVARAAAAWSNHALPDPGVVSDGRADPNERTILRSTAVELETFWRSQCERNGWANNDVPPGVQLLDWRVACRDALVSRMLEYRAEREAAFGFQPAAKPERTGVVALGAEWPSWAAAADAWAAEVIPDSDLASVRQKYSEKASVFAVSFVRRAIAELAKHGLEADIPIGEMRTAVVRRVRGGAL